MPGTPEGGSAQDLPHIGLGVRSHAVISIQVRGAVDEPSTATLQHLLVDVLMRHRPDRVVVDLREATTLDQTAVGMLLAAADTADDLRVALSVCNPSRELTDQLVGAGLPRQRVATWDAPAAVSN